MIFLEGTKLGGTSSGRCGGVAPSLDSNRELFGKAKFIRHGKESPLEIRGKRTYYYINRQRGGTAERCLGLTHSTRSGGERGRKMDRELS